MARPVPNAAAQHCLVLPLTRACMAGYASGFDGDEIISGVNTFPTIGEAWRASIDAAGLVSRALMGCRP